MEELTQEELGRFLQFCTGSSRVPLNGFSALESNRGEIAKFTIESVNITNSNKNTKAFIKAHTCFNRIDLPLFNTEEQLKEALDFVVKNEIVGFGID